MYILLLFLSFRDERDREYHAQSNRLGIRTEVRYDYLSDSYIFEDKIGEIVVGTPTPCLRGNIWNIGCERDNLIISGNVTHWGLIHCKQHCNLL